MGYRSRIIPAFVGPSGDHYGGGVETIQWIADGPMRLSRSVNQIVSLASGVGGDVGSHFYVPLSTLPSLPPFIEWNDASLAAGGTTAISRSAPTNPSFSLLTAVGELYVDGFSTPPGFDAWKEKTLRAKSAGSEYLNVEFGWKPLVSDIRSFCKTVEKSSYILEAYRKKANKDIRVGYSFPEEGQSSNSFGTQSAWMEENHSATATRDGYNADSTTQFRRSWFEGTYQYPLPIGDSAFDRASRWGKQANHLLGIFPTPSAIWQLAPWSWAIDWFTNMGDIVNNVSNMMVDGLVLKDGYMMSHARSMTQRSITARSGNFSGSCSSYSLLESKKRDVASPFFGFGVSSDLTPRQIAILAALGISR